MKTPSVSKEHSVGGLVRNAVEGLMKRCHGQVS
jgi:hypothetical protein